MKPKIAVHKFSSCDGCQLAFLNAGEDLITLSTLVDITYFAEAGYLDEEAEVDIAFVEGSVSTPQELERIQKIRANSRIVVTIGACATSGGLQALRNMHDHQQWLEGVYAQPQTVSLLADSTPIAEHIRVDLELWGCPVSGRQVLGAVRSLLFGVLPPEEQDKVCLECKRRQNVCVMVTRGEPCMGPVTRTGCGAICPSVGRDCYACYGPSELPNTTALANRFEGLGLQPAAIARRFLFINSHAAPFQREGRKWQGKQG
ncbi:MAG: sulfhydrogenase subunit delta [Gammaproteobacteria bacterium]|nr:sulfhydrogenase subunit delta [Gammaproteobacteria bacterium]